MDDQGVEDDPWSDDDLDALPSDAFRGLEEDAFRSTQQGLPPFRAPVPVFKAAGMPAAASLAGGLGRLTVAANQANGGQDYGSLHPSSDYGDLDDEMLDGEIFDANEQPELAAAVQQNQQASLAPGGSTQREHWRQQRYARSDPYIPSKSPRINGVHRSPAAKTSNLSTVYHMNPQNAAAPDTKPTLIASQTPSDPSDLHAEVERLLHERKELQRAVQAANKNVYAKAGEIAIVRANASKLEKEYDTRNEEMRKQNAENEARLQQELEKAKDALQKVSTEKTFLEHDLTPGAKPAKSLKKPAKKVPRPAESISFGEESGARTPKRHKSGLGDGFNDDEIQLLSPSKLVHRSKPGTPKAGAKRKRKVPVESPRKRSLDIGQPMQDGSSDVPVLAPLPRPVEPALQSRKPQNQDFSFIQSFLDHRFSGAEERTIEQLARYKLLSNPSKTLSTILMDKLSPKHLPPHTENLPAAIALEVISIWAQCMQERYHDPIHLLLDQVRFILIIKPLRTAPDLTNDLMSLLQETADVIIIPRCQKKPPRDDRAKITSTDCLEVIHLMATQLSISRDESTRFWRTMRFDFIMMLLSFIHPLNELHLIIRVLHTSILPNSFAMIIPPNDGKQDATEARVIENLSRLLVEPPRPTQGEPSLTGVELAELRLAIVVLLEDMGANDYAALAICRHRLLLGRLVRLMNDSLASAYDYMASHPYLIELVNSATRLLYYFLNNYPDHINMQERLSVIPGGEKKFLIVLTRLAFSEGVYLEEGIEDDVVDTAHRMLEERVSPEEAEGLMSVMSSAPITRATTTRRGSGDVVYEEADGAC